METQRYIVIGGGLLGLLSALELAQMGHHVMLLERQAVGRESTWAGGGILSPLHPWRYPDPVTRLAQASQSGYPALCAELAATTGIDPEWTQSGLMLLDPGDEVTARHWADQHGYRLEEITRRAVEPALAHDGPALWLPDVAQVRNPRLAQALRARLPQLGVEIREQCQVTGIIHHNGVVTGLESSQGTLTAQGVIVAAGAWSGELLSALPHPPQVAPVKGQMLLFQAEPGVLNHMVLAGDRYLIPRRDGRILAGSTLEPGAGFDKTTTQEAHDSLREAAIRLVPALADYPLERQWAGLRPGSPAGVPYIGEHPAVRGLFINSGHFRNGVVLGLASARLLTDLIVGSAPRIDPTPYALTTPRGA